MVDLSARWESLARENAEFYIWTDVAHGDDFFASGRRDAAAVLALATPFIGRRGRALEIGCGVGRLLIPVSREFGEAIGVDIAPTMIAKLGDNCRSAGVENVTGVLAGDPWDRVGPVDLAYSRIVFQHIEDWEQISGYFRRIASCLAPDGAFYAQFDTRSPNLLYHVKNGLPDALLRPNHRRGVRRIRRTRRAILDLARRHGLVPVHEQGAGTNDTIFIFKRLP